MRRLILSLIVSLTLIGACSPDDSGTDDPAAGDAALDAAADATSDAAATDLGPETSPPDGSSDAGASDTADADGGCRYQADCADDELCHDGTCRAAPTCGRPGDWSSCVYEISQYDESLARRAYCESGTCTVGCALDTHCPDGEVCTDNGACREFGGNLEADPPGGGEQAPLEAGVGSALMEFPIGLSLGGYGSRAGGGSGRYVERLRPSHGQMHGLHARAIALDNGARQLVFVRLPIIFTSGALHEAVARRLHEETGANWRGSLMISATHTHSGPARFYHLPEQTLLPLGAFGTDNFHDQAFEWLVDSTTSAALDALDDRAPAAFGSTILEDFDGDDAIASDRWEQTPPFDDNRLLAMRIDDPDGTPRAVAVSFGMHGTIHSGDYFNGDAIAGIEHGLEAALAEAYGTRVPVLFFNQNGGTMSPRGGGRNHGGPARFEKLGRDLADRIVGDLEGIETDRSLELAGTTHRFPISYERLGYGPDEWGGPTLDTVDENYQYGGLQCASDGDDDYATHDDPEDLDCLAIHEILYHRPPSLFVKSQMSAFRLGDVRMVTAPGELSMELGWQIARRLRDDHGLDPANTWTFGFAQDHQFYLLPTNLRGGAPSYPGFEGPEAPEEYPDRAFSYLQGGYEASMSFWGWKFGDYLVERASRTVAKLEAPGEFDRQVPETLPAQFSEYGSEPFPVDEGTGAVGEVNTEPPEQVARFEPVEFAWIGGDPGAEMPQAPRVALQRREDGAWQTVETDRRRPYTNREPVMLTRVHRYDDDREWVVRWEELRDFPTGEYRFRVEGHWRSDGARESYTATSRAFELAASEDLRIDGGYREGAIEGTVTYPPATPFELVDETGDPGQPGGHFRLRDPDVPPGTGAPPVVDEDLSAGDVTVTLEQDQSTVAEYTGGDLTLGTEPADRDGASQVPTTRFSAPADGLASGEYTMSVEVTDAHGNTGTLETNVTVSE